MRTHQALKQLAVVWHEQMHQLVHDDLPASLLAARRERMGGTRTQDSGLLPVASDERRQLLLIGVDAVLR